jgi:hypothetical protein
MGTLLDNFFDCKRRQAAEDRLHEVDDVFGASTYSIWKAYMKCLTEEEVAAEITRMAVKIYFSKDTKSYELP